MGLKTITAFYIFAASFVVGFYYYISIENDRPIIETSIPESTNYLIGAVIPVYENEIYKGIIKADKIEISDSKIYFTNFNLNTKDISVKCNNVSKFINGNVFYLDDEFIYKTPQRVIKGKKGIFDLKNN